MNLPDKPIALTFMAHPDDAEFLCAGTLVRLREAGWEIHIATAAPGDCGTATHNRWDISSIRTRESAEAASRIGATYHCIDERDGFVVYDKTALRRCWPGRGVSCIPVPTSRTCPSSPAPASRISTTAIRWKGSTPTGIPFNRPR
jgi:hypothetical protein